MAATADAWLYGIDVPRVGSEAGAARSAESRLDPTSAIRRVIEPPAAGSDVPGLPTVVSPLISPSPIASDAPADGHRALPGTHAFH